MGQICSFCGSKEESAKSGAFADTSTSSDLPESHHSQQHPLSSSPYHQNADGTLSALGNSAHNMHHLQGGPNHENDPHLLGPSSDPNNPAGSAHDGPSGMDAIDENERQRRLKQYQLEQAELARREAIVNAASQSMVPVGGSQGNVSGAGGGSNGGGGMMMNSGGRGGGGGINTYYDPAYAAAAAQDILNSAARSGGMVFADDAATRAAWQMSASVMGVMPVSSSRNGSSKDVMDTLGKGRWDGIRLGSRGSGVAGCGGENPEYYLDDLAEAFLEMMVPAKTTLFGGCPSIVENLP
mmetsp:Transcript_16564/g.33985  ORF Transcript_16564/g.33985 Transcript_16564/m.33985 type:complete len:296 (-) Transcript_16564:327-1214(-)